MRHDDEHVGRRKPARGVHIYLGEPTIVSVTVCSEKRAPWIAQPTVHELLKKVWGNADAWLVGNYQLMPDHIHLFAAPRNLAIPFNRWMSYWKRLFTQGASKLPSGDEASASSIKHSVNWHWQSLHWDTRLRRTESYTEKWHYIRENPVKEGLVACPDDWPYQGMMNLLRW
jgi:REP element-mobilizing transposase RayT